MTIEEKFNMLTLENKARVQAKIKRLLKDQEVREEGTQYEQELSEGPENQKAQ